MTNVTDVTNIANEFITWNRMLVSANQQDDWVKSTSKMRDILNLIDQSHDSIIRSSKNSDIAKIISVLLTITAEAGQYRHEQFNPDKPDDFKFRDIIDNAYLPMMGELRKSAISLAKIIFSSPPFQPLWNDIKTEIFPLLESMDPDIDPDRFMPFRVIQIGNIVERLYSFRLRTKNLKLVGDKTQLGLLQEIYNRKYLRFGTSGIRGRWQVDFTESRAKQVAQAICDFLKASNVPDYVGAENLTGKTVVIGYDSRKNARMVAEWVASVCIANEFYVELANRDTPTPALVYYLTEYLNPENTAGLINCTASHNPPEWQGVKFNPRLGYPAPTNVTDFIAFRVNEIQLLDQSVQETNINLAEKRGILKGFDPITSYAKWLLESGENDSRISLDLDSIRKFFSDKLVIVDEMHGAGRGYLTKVLSEIGVRHKVIHAERDPNIPGLDYANPEEPFINDLKTKVTETGACLGLGLDTDADRFGIVDEGGKYFRPNQILSMLVRYLGIDREITGRVIATQTGSPLIEILAGNIPNNEANKPLDGTVPLYVRHPFYKLRVGSKEDRIQENTFLVPVGIKYIEEIRRMDREYKIQKTLPENWRDSMLIGGEESSGLTTRGHITDKDGIWADLLVMDMMAYYANSTKGRVNTISDIWKETITYDKCWNSYGGKENQGSNTGRTDIDAILEVKEELISYFLDYSNSGNITFADMEITFLGGIRYDIAELQLRDKEGNDQHFLRVRASGTEPINRIYVESADPNVAELLKQKVLSVLEELSIRNIMGAESKCRLVDILCNTAPRKSLNSTILETIEEKGWELPHILEMMESSIPTLELRTRKIAQEWINHLA